MEDSFEQIATDILADPMPETRLAAYFERDASIGGCPALLNDDMGHWAIGGSGMQQIAAEGPIDMTTTFFIEKGEWSETIRGALQIWAKEDEPEEG